MLSIKVHKVTIILPIVPASLHMVNHDSLIRLIASHMSKARVLDSRKINPVSLQMRAEIRMRDMPFHDRNPEGRETDNQTGVRLVTAV